MWPGFYSRIRRHMWVEFVVGSVLCSERFFSGFSGFPLSSKTNISKFQFDLGMHGHFCKSSCELLSAPWVNKLHFFTDTYTPQQPLHNLHCSSLLNFKVLTWDASISINISVSIRSLCAGEDSRDISISISFLLMLKLMLIFSEDIVDISIKCPLIGW